MKFRSKVTVGLLGTLLMCGAAWAQTFPSKPVTLMVPYPAGGVSDVIARTLNTVLAKHLGQPVLVVALGTGSVAMRLLADGTERQVGGWGFNIGDEGGGAWLGKQAVRELLWQVDSLTGITSPLLSAVALQIGEDDTTLLPWLKTASPNDYAALAPLVFSHAGRCGIADMLLERHVEAVQQLLWRAREQFDLPVVLLGGLAEVTAPLLNSQCRALLQNARGSALDGALILASTLTTPLQNNTISGQHHDE